jgi:hypothetical protein
MKKAMAKHPNKHIREALKYAEKRGWKIRKSGPRAHAWTGAGYSQNCGPVSWPVMGEKDMSNYRFAVIIASSPMSHEEILDAADALGQAGCTDASIRGHSQGMELLFERAARSLQAAISSAIADVENAGFQVLRVEMEREAIPI